MTVNTKPKKPTTIKQRTVYVPAKLSEDINSILASYDISFSGLVRSLYKMFISFSAKIKSDFIENNYFEYNKRYTIIDAVHRPSHFYNFGEIQNDLKSWSKQYGIRVSYSKLVISLLYFFIDMTDKERKVFLDKNYKNNGV